MSTTDIAQSFMGELIAEIWNRTNAESTGPKKGSRTQKNTKKKG